MNPYSPNSTIIITIYPCIYLYIQQLGDQPHRFHLWWPCRLQWLAIFHNRFFYSLSLSLSLSLLACVHICVWTWLYICTVFTHSLWYVCWNRSFSNFLFKQKCHVICLVPIYQIYTQVWKLKRNGIMEMKKEELGSPLFGASGNFAWLLKAIPKELY